LESEFDAIALLEIELVAWVKALDGIHIVITVYVIWISRARFGQIRVGNMGIALLLPGFLAQSSLEALRAPASWKVYVHIVAFCNPRIIWQRGGILKRLLVDSERVLWVQSIFTNVIGLL